MKTLGKKQRKPFYKEAYLKARVEEAALLPFLQRYFNDPLLLQTEGAFSKFDFVSDVRSIELKTRGKCGHDAYPDIMINANKIDEAQKNWQIREYVFCFKFADESVWYWEYDPTVELEMRMGGRMDRGYDERKLYYFIPTKFLKNLPLL